MPKFQSRVLQNKQTTVTTGQAGVMIAQEVEFTVGAGGFAANDVIEFAYLPADARVVDVIVNLPTVGTAVVGLMNGDVVGSTQFINAATSAGVSTLRMDRGFNVPKAPDTDRIVGFTFNAAIPAGTKVYMQVQYAQ